MSAKELEPLRGGAVANACVEVDNVDVSEASAPSRARRRPFKARVKRFITKNAFMILTVSSVLVGIPFGFSMRVTKPSDTVVMWLRMPGEVFIRILTMTIVPMIVASVIVVTSKLDPKANGKISIISFTFMVIANVSASMIGFMCSLVLKPGKVRTTNYTMTATQDAMTMKQLTTSDVFADLVYNIFPDNVVAACLFKSQTKYVRKVDKAVHALIQVLNSTMDANSSMTRPISDPAAFDQAVILEERVVHNAYAMNLIGVIFISCSFGIASRLAGEKSKPFITFFESVSDVITVLMRGYLWVTPVGVCFMIAGSVAAVDSIVDTFSSLGLFIVTVILALFIHFLLLVIVQFVAARENQYRLLKHSFPSWFISFATTVPVIAIPEMYEGCDKIGISRRVSRVVIPFAAAMKGDGAAVFISAACVFVAQISNYELNVGNYIVIILLTSSAAMALPNIPSGGIIIIITVMSSVGCPLQAVALLFALDWFLDRLRSGSIALSHMYCAAFTYAICKDSLDSGSDIGSKSDTSCSSTSKNVISDLDGDGKCIISMDDKLHEMPEVESHS